MTIKKRTIQKVSSAKIVLRGARLTDVLSSSSVIDKSVKMGHEMRVGNCWFYRSEQLFKKKKTGPRADFVMIHSIVFTKHTICGAISISKLSRAEREIVFHLQFYGDVMKSIG